MEAEEMSFRKAELYGGAITVDIPQKWLDASDIRQVPSHQEVHLSPTGLTNLVIEINEYVTPEETTPSLSNVTTTLGNDANPRSPDFRDKAAILYHLHDLIDDTDSLAVISPPKRVQLSDPTLAPYPSWLTHGKVDVRTPIRDAPTLESQTMESILSSSGHPPQRLQTSTTTIHLMVIRLPEKETDLCFVVNVPHSGLSGEQVADEEASAEKVLDKIAATLKICEWDLFA